MIDSKLIELGKELIALAEKYSEPRTIKIKPEPEVKTCEHEPMQLAGVLSVLITQCKHCKVNLKPEKWVEV